MKTRIALIALFVYCAGLTWYVHHAQEMAEHRAWELYLASQKESIEQARIQINSLKLELCNDAILTGKRPIYCSSR